jgi:hypothetical protein
MCTKAFLDNWVGCFGVLATVTTDRDIQFSSAVWTSPCIQHVLTKAHHPQSNGMVECVHMKINRSSTCMWGGSSGHSHLPWVLLGL